jgi:hypothetical protein
VPPVNLNTVNHRDLAHYEACPRLLGVYAYLTAHPEARAAGPQRREVVYVEGLDGLAFGSIGEAMTAEMLGDFDGNVDSDAVIGQTLEALKRRGARLTANIRRQVEKAVREAQGQFTQVHNALQERYGRLKLLGRGKAHYGHVPGYAAPDFVAVAKNGNTILVEAKYQRKLTMQQVRQAEWYNAVATAECLQVRWVPQVGEKMRGSIQSSFRDPQECVLVNWSPSGDGITPVSSRAHANKETLRELWRVKRMGFQGVLPETDCEVSCRCQKQIEKHELELPEGNLEVARPPVLHLGQAYVEEGVDLEGRGLANMAVLAGGPTILRDLRMMHYHARRTDHPQEAEERLAGLLDIPEDRAREIIRQGTNVGRVPDEEVKVDRAWGSLVGDVMTMRGIKAQATRTYAAARDVDRLVKRANDFWDKAEG